MKPLVRSAHFLMALAGNSTGMVARFGSDRARRSKINLPAG
jgi:hypothetical protein